MSRFEECLALVLKSEGGYSDHPNDRGGCTNKGITQRVYDDWRAGRGLSRQPVVGISGEEVAAIYRDKYWKPGKCEFMPKPLDYIHFDGCVNHGVGQAGKFLQRALQVTADGAVGPVTLNAVGEEYAAGQLGEVIRSILEQRESFYRMLAENHPAQQVFLVGWLNRINDVRGVA